MTKKSTIVLTEGSILKYELPSPARKLITSFNKTTVCHRYWGLAFCDVWLLFPRELFPANQKHAGAPPPPSYHTRPERFEHYCGGTA